MCQYYNKIEIEQFFEAGTVPFYSALKLLIGWPVAVLAISSHFLSPFLSNGPNLRKDGRTYHTSFTTSTAPDGLVGYPTFSQSDGESNVSDFDCLPVAPADSAVAAAGASALV